MGHHNHSIQWQHNHSTIRWRIRGNLQTITTTWRGWRCSPFVCSRLRKLNYPDEGVAEKGPATSARFMATYETSDERRLPQSPRDTWKPGPCASLWIPLWWRRAAASRCPIDPDWEDKEDALAVVDFAVADSGAWACLQPECRDEKILMISEY